MRKGFTVINNLLPFLKGREVQEKDGKFFLDSVTESFVSALRPSSIEIGTGPWTLDSRSWRVRVHLKKKHQKWQVKKIEQEVEVVLPKGIENGYDLTCQLMGVANPFKGQKHIMIANSRTIKKCRNADTAK